jgi:hypothetical protein
MSSMILGIADRGGGKTAFSINGTIMEFGPADIRLQPAAPTMRRTINGGWVAAPREKGARITVRWGDRFASMATVKELDILLGVTLAHTIAWTDPDGTAQSFDVILEPFDRRHSRRLVYSRVGLTFSERAG